jgi:hypothetical protein
VRRVTISGNSQEGFSEGTQCRQNRAGLVVGTEIGHITSHNDGITILCGIRQQRNMFYNAMDVSQCQQSHSSFSILTNALYLPDGFCQS